MKSKRIYLSIFIFLSIILSAAINTQVSAQGVDDLILIVNKDVLEWHTGWEKMTQVLTIHFPDGSNTTINFKATETPAFAYTDLGDGTYRFELIGIPERDFEILAEGVTSEDGRDRVISSLSDQESFLWTGTFLVKNQQIVQSEPETAHDGDLTDNMIMDVLHYDDVIITGSLCVGFDCIDGESFGYATIKLKENNLQLLFEDTSIGTFPTNDWKIQINDTTSGGANYFTIWDVDGGRRPFTIEAGAPAHSLYVEDYGRVGLGTSTPVIELHIVDGDSPGIRLDQDGSSGWAAQKWDIVGNETNFFVRDGTNGSKLTFRIQPNTPSNTLTLKSTGFVGIGTWSPEAKLEVETTGNPAAIRIDQTDGSAWDLISTDTQFLITDVRKDTSPVIIDSGAAENSLYLSADGNIGVGTDAPTSKLYVAGDSTLVGNTAVLDDFSVAGESSFVGDTSISGVLEVSGNTEIMNNFSVSGVSSLGGNTSISGELDVSGNASVDGNLVLEGYLSEKSDVNAKENFMAVNHSEILEKVSALPITSWNYINDAETTHIGPMAQDFYGAFGVGLDDKHLSAMDVNGVTLASIQELNRLVNQKENRIAELEDKLEELETHINHDGSNKGFSQSEFLVVVIGVAFVMGFLGMALGGLIFSRKLQK